MTGLAEKVGEVENTLQKMFVKLRNDCSFSQYNSSYYDSSDYNITRLCYFYKVMSL